MNADFIKYNKSLSKPDDIRKAGGALFGDDLYGYVFAYHNGEKSYYAVRSFRGILRL